MPGGLDDAGLFLSLLAPSPLKTSAILPKMTFLFLPSSFPSVWTPAAACMFPLAVGSLVLGGGNPRSGLPWKMREKKPCTPLAWSQVSCGFGSGYRRRSCDRQDRQEFQAVRDLIQLHVNDAFRLMEGHDVQILGQRDRLFHELGPDGRPSVAASAVCRCDRHIQPRQCTADCWCTLRTSRRVNYPSCRRQAH